MSQEIREEFLREFEVFSNDGESITIQEYAVFANIGSFSDTSTQWRRTDTNYYNKDRKRVLKSKEGGYHIPSLGNKPYYEKND